MNETHDHTALGGWEQIWRSGDIPPRFTSDAAPNQSVIALADSLPAGAAILDIGCGVGRHVTYLGGRGFRMAGLDISPTGIQMTAEVCAARGISFEGKVSDMRTLAWPDETFEGALAISTLHHQRRADIFRSLQEVGRVLKPGGLFVVDFPGTQAWGYQLLREEAAAGLVQEIEPNTFVDERVEGYDIDGRLPHHYVDEAALRELFGAFELVRLHPDFHEIETPQGKGLAGKWVVVARKPLAG